MARSRPLRSVALSSGTNQVRVDAHLVADAVAGRAGAEKGVVEREQARLDLGNREARRPGRRTSARRRGGAARRSRPFRPPIRRRAIPSASSSAVSRLSERRAPDVVAHHEAVHHHVDVVLVLLVERRRVRDLVIGAVDLDALETLLLPLGELLAVLALAPAHHRGEQVEPRLLRQRQHPVDHLRDRLALDRQARGGESRARPRAPRAGACSRRSR